MPTIKPCFVAEITYVEGAAEKRAPYRAEHLERVAKLQAEGVLVVAGAFDDMTASLFIMDVASEDAAAAIVETDVFYKQKIWTGYTMRKLNRAV